MTHLLKGFLLLAPALFSAHSQGQKAIEYTEFDLLNGLHVILHEDHSTPIVAVTMMYHVGSKDEDTNRTGFAHFFEHLLFEGSKYINRHEFDKYVSGSGGTLNANTSNDRTFYYELLPSHQLPLGLWLESERLLHARVEQIGIETQREVVKEEKRMRIDNQPYASFISEICQRAFTLHPYRWVPIGSMAHLDAAEEKDYVKFYRTYYVPHNAVLSIAGDIDSKETKALIEKYFGNIPTGDRLNAYRDMLNMNFTSFTEKYGKPANITTAEKDYSSMEGIAFLNKHYSNINSKPVKIERHGVVEPPLKGEIRDTIFDNIQLPAVMMGYRTPQQGTKDFYALEVLSDVLSGGKSSRLQTNVVDEQLKALFALSFPFPLEDPGLAIFLAICNEGVSPDDLEKSIDKEIENLKEELIPQREYEKVMNSIEARFLTSYGTVAGKAEALANYHMYFGNANLVNTELAKYREVTREDIQRVAKTYLNKNNRVVLYYLAK
jgi:predicted Zn-dependent peptidase